MSICVTLIAKIVRFSMKFDKYLIITLEKSEMLILPRVKAKHCMLFSPDFQLLGGIHILRHHIFVLFKLAIACVACERKELLKTKITLNTNGPDFPHEQI